MGEQAPDVTADQAIALQAFTLLKNGMGGLDWAGLPFVVEHLGVQDVPALIEALHTIKTYSPPKDED